jgi:short subunit dehydrogenase-like uncharacterized protein
MNLSNVPSKQQHDQILLHYQPPRTLSDFIASYKNCPSSPETPSTLYFSRSRATSRTGSPYTRASSTTTSLNTISLSSKTILPLPTKPLTKRKSSTMPLRHTNNRMVETRTTKPTLMTRLRGRNANSRTVKTTTKIEPARSHHATATHTHHTTHTNTRTTRSSGWGNSRKTAQPVVHHKRHASIGDKVSGAMMKLRGSLTRRPGLKV